MFTLTKYEHLVIFPVHPNVLVNYRKSFRPSGAKNDPSDARLLLDILMLHRDKLRRLNPDTPETRTLQFMVEERRKLVHEKTRYSNRITAHLKMYFPQVLNWFDEIGSNIVADFLERWPSLEKLQRARLATIERFFIDHNSRDRARLAERIEQIRKAIPATTDAAVLSSCSTAIGVWAALLNKVLAGIATTTGGLMCSPACPHELLPWRRVRFDTAADCRYVEPAGAVRNRPRGRVLQRYRSCRGQQRSATVGALAPRLPQVPPPDLSRMGTPFDRALPVGPRILRTTAGQRETAPYSRPLACLQMDSHSVSLLEGAQTLRRGRLSARPRCAPSEKATSP